MGRSDPCDFTRDGMPLRFLWKRQQQIDVIAKRVVASGRNEDAALFEQGNVGGIKLIPLLDDQLDNAGP